MAEPAWSRHVSRSAAVIAASLYVGAVVALYPFRRVFEFDPDEGINAIKAVLVDRGYQLYSQIWNDQPPLFTYLLEWWCRVLGWETHTGRILVLLFAGLIIFAVYDALRRTCGHPAAVAAAVLLPCTSYFTRLSVSIMLGLPAIAFATLCMWALLRWAITQRRGWLLAAGVLMGLSLATKLFTIFLVPVFGLWVLLVAVRQQGRAARWGALAPPALWGLVVLLTSASVLVPFVPASEVGQLYQSHVAARAFRGYGSAAATIHESMRRDWEVVVLAGLGTALLALRRRGTLMIAPAWCGAAYWALRTQSLVWYHHYLLLTVPGCMIAGVAVGDLFARGWPSESRIASAMNTVVRVAALLVTVALVAALVRGEKKEPSPVPEWSDRDSFALELIKAYPKRSDVIVADRPMFACAAGYEVPPNLAVISQKRLATHNLTVQQFLETIDRERPEHVIFSWKLPDEFAQGLVDTMNDHYKLVYADMEQIRLRVFVRSDVAGDPLPPLLHAAEQVPNVAAGHDAIGIEWAKRGDTQQAIASFRRAHTLNPTAIRPCQHLAEALMAQGEYAEGFAVLQAAMQTDDASRYTVFARMNAWRLSTCPDATYRNGAEAEAAVRTISRLVKQPTLLDLETLAASLAAQGKFEAARVAAEAALDQAQRLGEDGAMRRIMTELESYRQGRAWTEPVRMPTT